MGQQLQSNHQLHAQLQAQAQQQQQQAAPAAAKPAQSRAQAAQPAANQATLMGNTEKEAWFKHVYQQYYETYKAQGGDDATCQLLAQKGVEAYKQQCLDQGVSLA